MKKIRSLFLFLIVVIGVISSCKKDVTEPKSSEKPVIYAVADKIKVDAGDTITISISAQADSGRRLILFEAEEMPEGKPAFDLAPDIVLKTPLYDATIRYTVPDTVSGIRKLVFRVTDDYGKSMSDTVNITIIKKPHQPKFVDFGIVNLGNQNSPTGGFWGASDCRVYGIAQAKANANKVDIFHYYGAQNEATLASPDNHVAEQFAAFEIKNWSVRRETRFKKLSSGFDFDAVKTVEGLQSAYANAPANADTHANLLEAGDVIAFRLQEGEYGLIKVLRVSGTSNTSPGSIQFHVKVQQ